VLVARAIWTAWIAPAPPPLPPPFTPRESSARLMPPLEPAPSVANHRALDGAARRARVGEARVGAEPRELLGSP